MIAVIKYVGTALPALSTTETLATFNVGAQQLSGSGTAKYTLKLRNSHAGTLLVESSSDGSTYATVRSIAVDPSPTNDTNDISVDLSGFPFARLRWTNGGTTQTTFDPVQTLSCQEPENRHIETDARIAAPVADATNNFATTIGTTHATYTVPDAWKGRRVRFKVVGSTFAASGLPPTVWLVFGTSVGVVADRTVDVTGSNPFTGSATICEPIGHGDTLDVYVRPHLSHFSIEADTASTRIWAFISDHPPTEV